MVGKSVRLLYLPNESSEGDQVGPRQAFEALEAAGQLAQYRAFSYLVHAKRHGLAATLATLSELIAGFAPDVLLWQHVAGFPITPEQIAGLKAAAPGVHLLYHEGDVYGRFVKRLPASTRHLMAAADTVALVGKGDFAELARSVGARRVLYSPHSVDTRRFGTAWNPTTERPLDVMMIGNRVSSRWPWNRMPGARERALMVKRLGKRFGGRFAVYGKGWEGYVGNQGPLPFAEQEAAQRLAWLTVSWDHFDTVDAYFSDRVPISLLSGVPHITNAQPGYAEVFGADAPLDWVDTLDALLIRAEQRLAQGAEALIERGRVAQAYGAQRFSAEVVYRNLLNEALA